MILTVCIIISQRIETKSDGHLKEVTKRNIPLIQFDRINKSISSHQVINDNGMAAYHAVNELLGQGYQHIMFLGRSLNTHVYNEGREGYLQALGIETANIYFNELKGHQKPTIPINKTVPCTMIYRDSIWKK